MPNSSARCAQLPRAVDKVPFYEALKKFKDYLDGSIDQVEEDELVFSNVKLKNFNEGGHSKKQSAGSAGNAGDSSGDAATVDASTAASAPRCRTFDCAWWRSEVVPDNFAVCPTLWEP